MLDEIFSSSVVPMDNTVRQWGAPTTRARASEYKVVNMLPKQQVIDLIVGLIGRWRQHQASQWVHQELNLDYVVCIFDGMSDETEDTNV